MRVCRKLRRWKSAFVREYPLAISSSIRISVAPNPVALEGNSASRSSKAGLSAQVPAEQIKTGLRRRRAIRLPGRACRLKLIAGDIDGRRQPFAKSLKPDYLKINKTQLQLGDGLRMRSKIIKQPNQLQLRIRISVEP